MGWCISRKVVRHSYVPFGSHMVTHLKDFRFYADKTLQGVYINP